MAFSIFEQKLKPYFPHINFLNSSTSSYLPGSILDNEENDYREGHIREILTDLPEEEWTLDYVEANLLVGRISGNSKIEGGANILGIIRLKSSVSKNYEMEYELSEITAVEFKKTSMIEIQGALAKLKRENRRKWKIVKHDYIVTESFFAKTFTIKFKKDGEVVAEAELKSDIEVSADTNINWGSAGIISITNNEKVPFGVKGFIVR